MVDFWGVIFAAGLGFDETILSWRGYSNQHMIPRVTRAQVDDLIEMKPFLKMECKNGFWLFPQDISDVVAEDFGVSYQTANPFPHIVLDNFLPDNAMQELLDAFPDGKQSGVSFSRDQEDGKKQYPPTAAKHPGAFHIFNELNSPAFLEFLEKLTGIPNLVPDPYFTGGGFHETARDGFLGVHADFTMHRKLLLERKLNLLIYLNKEWEDGYGGFLELWDKKMHVCEARIAPVYGRAVIFNTNADSYHGHPDPLKAPPHITRRSIALYYYRVPEFISYGLPERTTRFVKRPGSSDRFDWHIRTKDLARDLIPPILLRSLVSLKNLSRYKKSS